MKAYILFLAILFITRSVYAQYYEYTGKVSVLNIGASPLVMLHTKNNTDMLHAFSTTLEYGRMFRPGIFPTIGYSYVKNYNEPENTGRTRLNTLPFKDGHQISTSVEIRKQLFSKSTRLKQLGKCIFSRFGIVIAPEYNYLYSQQINNKSAGEFALKTGIYFYQGSNKINVSRNIIYSIYYRKGFTPLVSNSTFNGTENYYRDEIGVRMTIVFREMYRFGW
jgi:hypothetical protein